MSAGDILGEIGLALLNFPIAKPTGLPNPSAANFEKRLLIRAARGLQLACRNHGDGLLCDAEEDG
jgi:hypothetical protein